MPHGESSPPTAPQRQPQPRSVTPTTSALQGDPTPFSLLGGCCTQPRCAAWALPCFWVSVGADGAQHLHSARGVLQQEALTPSLPVNYRGSLGFGQDSVDSLPGNVGTQDVRDVQVGCVCPITLWLPWGGKPGHSHVPTPTTVPAAHSSVWSECCRRSSWMPAEWPWWVAHTGASWHATSSGSSPTPTVPAWSATPWSTSPPCSPSLTFLTGECCGPQLPSALALHVPLPLTRRCLTEVGVPYEPNALPDPAHLTVMLQKSPMSYINQVRPCPIPSPVPACSTAAEAVPFPQVRTPVLLMLGEDDKRVPPAQGLEYYRALKARGVPTR